MRRVVAFALGATALVGSGAVAVGWALAVPIGTRPRRLTQGPPADTGQVAPYPAESLGQVAAARDLFRLGRRPASVAYDPTQAAAAPLEQRPPKPMLVLVGLVAGTPMTAIVQGFPETDGVRVVRPGDVLGGLTVRGISPTEVRIVGMDTTWVLKVRTP